MSRGWSANDDMRRVRCESRYTRERMMMASLTFGFSHTHTDDENENDSDEAVGSIINVAAKSYSGQTAKTALCVLISTHKRLRISLREHLPPLSIQISGGCDFPASSGRRCITVIVPVFFRVQTKKILSRTPKSLATVSYT